jgi:hypothetical protein
MFFSRIFSRPRSWPPPLSSRRLSETLLDFSAPVTSHLPHDVEPRRLERHLRFAVAVWNKQVGAEWSAHGLGHMPQARTSASALDPSIRPFAEGILTLLVSRKRKRRFRDDLRAITALSVRTASPSGEPIIRTEASLPEALRLHYGLPQSYPRPSNESAQPSRPPRRRRLR